MSKLASNLDALPQKNFVVITPYLVDPRTAKRVNVGDGFIADSALRLIGARPRAVLSSRMPLSEADIELMNDSKLVLVAGANTLKSSFEITPNFTPALLDRMTTPVALCGIGHYGAATAVAQPLDAPSEAIMRRLLERFPYISLRCDESVRYLSASIPDRAGQVLMTSCPVVYPVDGVDGQFAVKDEYAQLVVTITDRANPADQLNILRAANGLFRARRRVLALHQNYRNADLCKAAESLGYSVFASESYEDFLDLYRQSDLHFGNRVHAHLKSLSLGRRSFLTPYDLRQVYFAESLDFPLITELPSPEFDSYDFSRVRARVAGAAKQMERFLGSVAQVLEER